MYFNIDFDGSGLLFLFFYFREVHSLFIKKNLFVSVLKNFANL